MSGFINETTNLTVVSEYEQLIGLKSTYNDEDISISIETDKNGNKYLIVYFVDSLIVFNKFFVRTVTVDSDCCISSEKVEYILNGLGFNIQIQSFIDISDSTKNVLRSLLVLGYSQLLFNGVKLNAYKNDNSLVLTEALTNYSFEDLIPQMTIGSLYSIESLIGDEDE